MINNQENTTKASSDVLQNEETVENKTKKMKKDFEVARRYKETLLYIDQSIIHYIPSLEKLEKRLDEYTDLSKPL
jgi:hypothetical protein